jgi:hypothetical protein
VGDSVVTRRNQRALATGRGWVKNGDQWTVTGLHGDGSIDVRRINGNGRATLPAGYVRENVELGYATTAHRAQGRTVDTAHAFVSSTTLREPLYVMATRGRESNRLYVDTMYDPDLATSHEPPEQLSPTDVLHYVLANSGADKSATLTITDTWANSHSITRLWAEYDTIARHANEQRYAALVAKSGLTAAEANACVALMRGDHSWPLSATPKHEGWTSTAGCRPWSRAEPSPARPTSPQSSMVGSPNGSRPQANNANLTASSDSSLLPVKSLTKTSIKLCRSGARSSRRTRGPLYWRRFRVETRGS